MSVPTSKRIPQQHHDLAGSSNSSHIKYGHRSSAHTMPRSKRYIGHYDIADRTFQLLSRHRAAACILFWSLTILLDILLQLPIEWFFLFYFILALVFRIFFIGGHIVLISIGAMCLSNVLVYYTVPFSFTSPFATGVAFGLMVSLIHGLNLKGVILAMTMYMLKPYIERQTLIVALNPPTVPSIVFLAPLASFCSAFGVLWLLYDLFGYLHASTDDLRDFFGITLPAPSIVTLKDVKDRSITLNWQCSSQATISKHLIEIDGVIIGESGKQETSVVIQGLYPDNTYRIRLWAITTRNWKTPSDYIVVRTLASVPVELELSSAENIRKESELIKKLIKESEELHQLSKEQGQNDNTDTKSQESKREKSDVASLPDITTEDSKSIAPTSTNVSFDTALHPPPSLHGGIPSPKSTVTDEQISALRVELEGKEASHALLIQQLSDLEKQYKQQEDQLKGEIATLREQQKQDDEPRQQAKIKQKELEESLRESEANKSKLEKEHRVEMEKRQKMMTQLGTKQKRLESLQQTLQQCEERLRSEKLSHQRQIQELEAALVQRSEDVKAAESSLKALQDSQKDLCSTIESKELELQKLQATINSPKGYFSWEQKSKDLDIQCAQLTQQLDQCKTENLQLQERLAEVTKNVSKVKLERETRRAQVEARKASRISAAEAVASQTHSDNQIQDHASNWGNSGWNSNLGTQLLSGLFQDNISENDVRASPVRKTTGPPPGLSAKTNAPEANKAKESNAPGYGRDRKNSGSQGSPTISRSPSRPNSQVGGPSKTQRYSGLRPRSPSTTGLVSPFLDELSGTSSGRFPNTNESPILTPDLSTDRNETRSRASSISSLPGFQSPLFDPSFAFSTHAQSQQDSAMTGQIFQNTAHSRQSGHVRPQQPQGHGLSPRARFQVASQLNSTPIVQGQPQWGGQNPSRTKPNLMSTNFGGRSPMPDLDNKGSQNKSPAQPLNYHRFFGQPSSIDMSGMLSENGSVSDHQLDEQNVIKSMFESPDTLDLRHHLRTVGSHSSLTTQSKILPSHLRSISTPGTSSPLSSPITSTLLPFQSSPTWDIKPIARPGSLNRMNSQAEGSSSSLNISDSSSPTSPQVMPFSRKTLPKGPTDRGLWGTYQMSDIRNRGEENTYGSMNFSQGDYSPGMNLDDTRMGSRWYAESFTYDPMLPMDSDPWGQGDVRPKSSRPPGVSPIGESTIGGVGMEGMLPSPTASSVSSLDTANPSSVDALVFADHYFSNRSHRGFDAPSSIAPSPFSNSSVRQPSVESGGGASKLAPGRGNDISATTSATQSSESDIFGYGLKLNPFGWTLSPESGNNQENQ
ncbi:hypothetical protein BGX21_003250 [Mortierella sp. AD011]|nr:hypothetical protein BGX20_007657 [Mortierella sp. AD010]KAF9377217.1 hypothetical protein BGX21_003250 [Mortierella sp. AD011]